MSVRLESWRITPTCRERGLDVAWEDAAGKLREVYEIQVERMPGATLTLSIEREARGANTGGAMSEHLPIGHPQTSGDHEELVERYQEAEDRLRNQPTSTPEPGDEGPITTREALDMMNDWHERAKIAERALASERELREEEERKRRELTHIIAGLETLYPQAMQHIRSLLTDADVRLGLGLDRQRRSSEAGG